MRPEYPAPEQPGLAGLLRAWRARAGQRSGRGRPLAQVEVAAGAGMSERWYRDLERGAIPRLDARTLGALADALRLCPDERATVFLYAAGGEPFPPVTPERGAGELAPLRRLLAQHEPEPAFLTDHVWNVLDHNAAAAHWFPWISEPRANVARWGLTDARAREQMADWPRHGRAFLAMLRFAMAQYPREERLRALLDEALADPECRRIWDAGPVVIAHRDGHDVRLRLPQVAPEPVEVVARVLLPTGWPGLRLTLLESAPNATPLDRQIIAGR
ncbi:MULTISPECIES: helix-turn-helix transcriptional regulator [Kitasatospora]|uniref:Helix-turn-helix transcriptional regulator n=1 Tax=Kitasatospora cystarginea TaxID=58350 RepID=A0ABP5RXX9_9ACTN